MKDRLISEKTAAGFLGFLLVASVIGNMADAHLDDHGKLTITGWSLSNIFFGSPPFLSKLAQFLSILAAFANRRTIPIRIAWFAVARYASIVFAMVGLRDPLGPGILTFDVLWPREFVCSPT